MNHRLSPSGHIPLNEETLSGMSPEERAFWEGFLEKIFAVIQEEEDKGSPEPLSLPPELAAEFRVAITVYDGDQYCQIAQIRNLFDCSGISTAATSAS